MSNCPKCLRPMNMGNSPNPQECTETNDDEGLCEAYAKIASLKTELEVMNGFYKVAISERNLAWYREEKLTKALQNACMGHEDDCECGGCSLAFRKE